MSNNLEYLIAQGEKVNWYSIPFSGTVQGMIKSGLHEWGFVIYRCVYGDDEAWQQYMKYLEADVIEGLEYGGGDVLLPQYAKWTVMEDRETLDGASIDAVRAIFADWRDRHGVEMEVPFHKRLIPMISDPPFRLPRFTYCLYVDQKCLNTMAAFAEKFPPAHRYARGPPLVAALIDGDYDETDYVAGGFRAMPGEQGQFPAVDGRTCKYLGWEYVTVNGLGGRYDWLHSQRLDAPMGYMRPPKIGPVGHDVLTDNGVEAV